MTERAADVVIVGAGVVGLFAAWELARSGRHVVVLERDADPRAASWAAGGILLPLDPWDAPPALEAALRYGRQHYPGLARELREATGTDPQLVTGDALIQRAAGVKAPDEPMARDELAALEPALRITGPVWRVRDAAHVRSPRLLRALRAHVEALGVEIRRLDAHLGRDGDRLHVRAGAARLDAECIVVAAGPWTAGVLAGAGVTLGVAPVKGQMLMWQLPRPLVRSIVITPRVYLVPREGGALIAGSTLEHTGFDALPSAAARRELHAAAAQLLPPLESLLPAAQWAALRPATPDQLPYVGALPGTTNGFVNAGHYRLGITLAPATGRLLADLVTGRAPAIDPQPFAPGRRA